MASYRELYTAAHFIKDEDSHTESETETSDEESEKHLSIFQQEDRTIAQLYRCVVDDIMIENRIEEKSVLVAVGAMRQEIHQGHKKGFRRFQGIDFNKAVNRCAYLRRYAICHTGLAKLAIHKALQSFTITEILMNKDLKVVSLGGGPGNDLVGFCSAIQDDGHYIERLDVKIVDINQGWVSVLPTILRKSKTMESGSLGKFLKKVYVTTSFMRSNLIEEDAFDDDDLIAVISEADVILMVKILSFISDLEAEDILSNVSECMKNDAILIFIDSPYDKKLFDQIPELCFLHKEHIKYNISFDPKRFNCPSIDSSTAVVAIFRKVNSVSSENEESSEEENI